MSKVVGLVNLYSDVSLKGLTSNRPAASVSFLGRYGIIDFALSNLSNSDIDNVGILIKEKPRSLFKHLGNGNAWNFNSKSGGVSLLYNELATGSNLYNHDVNNILANMNYFIKETVSDYVVITPAHIISTMDYSEILKAHKKSGAEITMVYKDIDNADKTFIGSDYLELSGGYVVGVNKNKGDFESRSISLETYVINTKTLMELVNYAKEVSSFFNLRDILAYVCDDKKIKAYEYKGFVRCIDSYQAYYDVSLEFLNMEVSSQVFHSNWPIFTNTNDTPPTKYTSSADVKKSFIANGDIIKGKVEGSILGRNVTIGENASVKNCIIFAGSTICDGATLENVIIDKNATIQKKKDLKGGDEPLYVREGDII